jgi:hypothetical protein
MRPPGGPLATGRPWENGRMAPTAPVWGFGPQARLAIARRNAWRMADSDVFRTLIPAP